MLLCYSLMHAGCYHLGRICPSSMRNIRTLAIPTFQNSTLIPRLETLVADITTRAFQADGTYKVVSETQADAILKCKLVSVSRTTRLLSPHDLLTARKIQLQILVTYQVVDRITDTLLQEGTAVGNTRYFVGEDPISQEQQELPMAARSMAASMINQLTEGW